MIGIDAVVRPAQLEDEQFLWLMLFYASRAYEQSVLPEDVAATIQLDIAPPSLMPSCSTWPSLDSR